MAVIRKLKYKLFDMKRAAWLKKLRKRLKNHDFTIISHNCIAGVIYHDLELRFDSPTINLRFKNCTEYPVFCKHIQAYTDCPMEDISAEENQPFPCARLVPAGLPPITLYMQHYKSFDDAKAAWQKRCKRIHWDNMFFIYEFYNDLHTMDALQAFDALPYRNKVALVHSPVEGIECAKYVSCYKNGAQAGAILEFTGNTGKRNLDEFDYVEFLNKGI